MVEYQTGLNDDDNARLYGQTSSPCNRYLAGVGIKDNALRIFSLKRQKSLLPILKSSLDPKKQNERIIGIAWSKLPRDLRLATVTVS